MLMIKISFIVAIFLLGCRGTIPEITRFTSAVSDPSPTIAFTQEAVTKGLIRSNEPAAASSYPAGGATLAYGTYLADFNADWKLDVYAVNHGQTPHRSGLWLGTESSFGQNLYTVAVSPSPVNWVDLSITNEIRKVADFNGDGLPDIYLISWSGLGALCITQPQTTQDGWTGPKMVCYGAWESRTFGDVNGDGKLDVETLNISGGYNVYKAYCNTQARVWRLNNGNPNPNTWTSTSDYFQFTNAEPGTLVDLNNDGLPDRVQGIELPSGQRGQFGTTNGGTQVYLGQSGSTYALQSGTGAEAITAPIVNIEDINEDGCLDLGADITGYRDQQDWWLQTKTGGVCTVLFTHVSRNSLPFYPGHVRYTADVDNSGTLDRIVLVHNEYGNTDGKTAGAHVYRKLDEGTYVDVPPATTGLNILGTSQYDAYQDMLDPGDWNADGRVDFTGTSHYTAPGTDAGISLWTNTSSSSNHWVKIRTPSVTGFFTGQATIEILEAGQLVTPAKVIRTGRTWATVVHHFGVGQRSNVDVRVTFPNAAVVTVSGVAVDTTITVEPQPFVDTEPPAVSISGATVTVTASATDNVGVVSVAWKLDGVEISVDNTSPYQCTFPLTPGTHSVVAKASDGAGNVTESNPFIIAE